ncbi:MAG: hypothetical protein QOI30_2888 [Mycobacterium sp.]|nr:hypothetical protein [Mycobacterium sp.]
MRSLRWGARAARPPHRDTRTRIAASFRRFLQEVPSDIEQLELVGARVLSPTSPQISGWLDDFAFLEGDNSSIAQAVQARHLQAIERSSFVWLVAPDGYVGVSAAFEISWAAAHGIPVLSRTKPRDIALMPYVAEVASIKLAVGKAVWPEVRGGPAAYPSILMDPDAGSDLAVRAICEMRSRLTVRTRTPVAIDPLLAASARRVRASIELL